MAKTATEIVTLLSTKWAADPRLADMIELAEEQLNEDMLCGQYQRALALLAMHMLEMSVLGIGSSGGPVSSETEGALSRSYATATAGNANSWLSTGWGRELTTLINTCPCTAMPYHRMV